MSDERDRWMSVRLREAELEALGKAAHATRRSKSGEAAVRIAASLEADGYLVPVPSPNRPEEAGVAPSDLVGGEWSPRHG